MDKLLPWLCLKQVSGIGNHLFKRLIERFGSPQRVFQTTAQTLLEVEGISQHLASAILKFKAPEWIAAELDRIRQKGYTVVCLTDASYPSLLREIPDPPPLLYVCGNLEGTHKNIAVVGSRHATAYGISATQKLCADLTAFDLSIVSGMALGIDTAAHQGALAGKGTTVAVLGSGFNHIYPAENRRLFKRISETGAVITEFALDTKPEPHNFPIRNRIISGMSLGTVVVEASRKSGSLITARLAAEQNREVFAVPGSIHSFKSTGTHTLIKQGAKLVENAQDVLEELTAYLAPAPKPAQPKPNAITEMIASLAPEEMELYKILGPYPEHIDAIVRKTSIEPGKLLSLLLQLELKGMVQQLPGKLFAISEPKP
ncbi:MAG: DNA-processing protein DprA [Desulfobacterales bacterium]|nr:DNA-processing protein DprA [Desulfobacterales bacterium]